MSKRNTKEKVQKRRGNRQRQSQVTAIIIVGVVAMVVAGLLIFVSQSQTSINLKSYQGIPQDVDKTGAIGLAIGKKDAPVVLEEYSDFSCSHCRDLAPTIDKLIEEYVKPGKLRIVYKPITFVGGPYSIAAARAAICAAEQGQGWEMQAQIWGIYIATSRPEAYTDNNLASKARDIGLDMGKFNTCYGSAETTAAIESVASEAETRQVTGTPTLFVNGELLNFSGADSLIQAISTRIAASVPSSGATVSPTP